MALAHKDHRMSVEEYFKLRESDPEHRYEYIDGYVYMMTGGSPDHSIIGQNIGRLIGNWLDDSPCIVYNSDITIQLSGTFHLCPDVAVSCDPRDQGASEDIQYPCLIVEVLSPSTEARDRGIKFEEYRACLSLQEYVLINSELPKIELFRREKNNLWAIHTFVLNDRVELTSIGLCFSVADAYKKTLVLQQNTQQ